MRTPHVLVEPALAGAVEGTVVPLDDERDHHLRRVLRRADGDVVQVTDGAGSVAPGVLVAEGVRLSGPVTTVPAPRPTIVVHHAVPKGRALDEVVRTLVELGVAEVHPVLTDHTESRPTGDKARSVGDRLRAVAASALEQARGAHTCRIHDPAVMVVTERDADEDSDAVLRLAAHPGAAATLGGAMATAGAVSVIHLLIGPEGGFSPREVDELADAGWQVVAAGDTVLRTVHAAPVLTAAVLALAGRFGRIGL